MKISKFHSDGFFQILDKKNFEFINFEKMKLVPS